MSVILLTVLVLVAPNTGLLMAYPFLAIFLNLG